MPTIDAGDVSVAYESHGSGPPVVLLHGAWLDRNLWTPQYDRFADDHRVVSVDLRDHGDSGHPDDGYGVPAMAEDVRAVMDALDLDSPVVCGLSLGGVVAQQLAAANPGRLGGLALAATVSAVPPVSLPPGSKPLLLPRGGGHLAARMMGASTYFRSLLQWVETMEGRRWLAATDPAREYALGVVDRFDADRFLRVFDALYGFDGVDLSAVTCPSLVVHGDQEARAVQRDGQRLTDRLGADRVVVDDAAHLCNRDAASGFGDALERLLAQVPAA